MHSSKVFRLILSLSNCIVFVTDRDQTHSLHRHQLHSSLHQIRIDKNRQEKQNTIILSCQQICKCKLSRPKDILIVIFSLKVHVKEIANALLMGNCSTTLAKYENGRTSKRSSSLLRCSLSSVMSICLLTFLTNRLSSLFLLSINDL